MTQRQPVLTFDGIDDYIEIPYSKEHNPNVFTLSCWAKLMKIPPNFQESSLISSYCWKPRYKGYFFMQRANRNTVNFWLSGGEILGSVLSSLNVWTHLAATYDGSKSKFYINGQGVGERIISPLAANDRAPLAIGALISPEPNGRGHYFAGQIAEVCIWNKARTQQEIESDMGKRLTGKEEGLVGYWPLNEGSGNTATDKTSNGKNGIIRGATWSQQEIPLNPAEPTTGEFKVPTNSATGFEFTNKLTKEATYKFAPSGTWKPKSDFPDCTAAGVKGFAPELQAPYLEALKPYQQYLKYQNNTYFALVAVNKTTGVVTEVGQETTIVLRAGETLTFVVNDLTVDYTDNTGTLTVKWSAT